MTQPAPGLYSGEASPSTTPATPTGGERVPSGSRLSAYFLNSTAAAAAPVARVEDAPWRLFDDVRLDGALVIHESGSQKSSHHHHQQQQQASGVEPWPKAVGSPPRHSGFAAVARSANKPQDAYDGAHSGSANGFSLPSTLTNSTPVSIASSLSSLPQLDRDSVLYSGFGVGGLGFEHEEEFPELSFARGGSGSSGSSGAAPGGQGMRGGSESSFQEQVLLYDSDPEAARLRSFSDVSDESEASGARQYDYVSRSRSQSDTSYVMAQLYRNGPQTTVVLAANQIRQQLAHDRQGAAGRSHTAVDDADDPNSPMNGIFDEIQNMGGLDEEEEDYAAQQREADYAHNNYERAQFVADPNGVPHPRGYGDPYDATFAGPGGAHMGLPLGAGMTPSLPMPISSNAHGMRDGYMGMLDAFAPHQAPQPFPMHPPHMPRGVSHNHHQHQQQHHHHHGQHAPHQHMGMHPQHLGHLAGHAHLQAQHAHAAHISPPFGGYGVGMYLGEDDGLGEDMYEGATLSLPNVDAMRHIEYFTVEFKAGRRGPFFVKDGQRVVINVDDLVIVEADRGKDLGRVVDKGPHCANSEAKVILRLAFPQEVALLAAKAQEEMRALQMCQSKIRQKKIPMEVVDAEYQWDRRKLTFSFVADKRIDFRELVRELFKVYKTRIWMCLVDDKKAASK